MKTLSLALVLAAAGACADAGDFICVADALNIRAEPSPDARVVAVVKYGESLVMAEPRDGSGWCKVRTPAGIEGFAFTQYLMRAEDYRVLERVIAAAKRNDVETTAAELAALGASKVEAVWPAPTGDAALVNIGFNRDVILAAGEGVLGSIEVFGATSKAL